MLAMMIAPTVGQNPFEPGFIISVIAIVAISSFGVAGVGAARHLRLCSSYPL